MGEKLSEPQIETLRKVYGNSIDYTKVRLKTGSAGLLHVGDQPFAHGNTIYMKDAKVTDALLVHEMAHVWQNQNGGTDYMSEALWSQKFGKGYDWESSVPKTKWANLEPEQQAEFLMDAFKSGYFDNPSQGFSEKGTDYTKYLEDALKNVRNGQGAP